MKILKNTVKIVFFIVLFFTVTSYSFIFYLDKTISSNYKINRGEILEIDSPLPITVEYNGSVNSRSILNKKAGDKFSVDLKLFGAIPFSSVNVEVVDEMYVAVLGNPFGMKLYTEGVIVIDLTDVVTKKGTVNPAKESGLKKGDYISTANGIKITCNEDLLKIVSESNGQEIRLEIIRSGKIKTLNISPVFSTETSNYHIGIWVRDSSAGIGTLTFYSPSSNTICGLGHGICDEDTGKILTLNSGEMVAARIVSIEKSANGSPGELKGGFTNEVLADININNEKGVYGNLKGKIEVTTLTEIALKQEVKNAEAQILCTIDGETPKLYSCTIKKRSSNYHSDTQNLTVTITDPELIEKTGGIVQGMSGSPIIQNGKLVGALTHVLIDDSKTGYGIFAENMLETAQSVAEEQKFKEAG